MDLNEKKPERMYFYTPRKQYPGIPRGDMCGDFMPYFRENMFYLFYLHKESIWCVQTADFLHYSSPYLVVARGGDDDQDWHVGTGCVIEYSGLFYLFYTGFRRSETVTPQKHEQVIMRAVSRDLYHWTKDPDFFMVPDQEHVDDGHWRDPDVFWNGDMGCFCMVVTSNEKTGAFQRKGCTALYVSDNVTDWKFKKIIYAPRKYIAHECHDAFKMGEKWYLIFSNFNKWWETRYRISDQLEGGWHMPPGGDDLLDGRQFYAAKTVLAGEKRYLAGWHSVKEGCTDSGKCIWGGTLQVYELIQRADGTLGVKPVEQIEKSFAKPVPLYFEPRQGEWKQKKWIEGTSETGFGWCGIGKLPETVLFETDVTYREGTEAAGLMLHVSDEKLSRWCQLRLDISKNMVSFDRFNRADGDQSYEETRPFTFTGQSVHVKVIMSGEILSMFVNDVALSSRCYACQAGSIGLFVEDGSARFENSCMREPR